MAENRPSRRFGLPWVLGNVCAIALWLWAARFWPRSVASTVCAGVAPPPSHSDYRGMGLGICVRPPSRFSLRYERVSRLILILGMMVSLASCATLAFDPGFKIHWVSEKPTFSPDGKLAYMQGRNTMTVPGANGGLVTIAGRGITIWRLEPDGQWRCVVDIWNDPPRNRPRCVRGSSLHLERQAKGLSMTAATENPCSTT